MWLAPGGHTDEEELPHQAAEREFWEETGLKVKAVSAGKQLTADGQTTYHPLPFAINLHWISPENYANRLKSTHPQQRVSTKKWSRGCEQHMVFVYLVQSLSGFKFKQNIEETDGIGWFGLKELAEMEIIPEIVAEAKYAIKLAGKK
jgi:8-oxo-dGTP pyrophosphatase MutT (NUDIX family)